jgi:hypothetical protein
MLKLWKHLIAVYMSVIVALIAKIANQRYLCVTEKDAWVSEAAVMIKKHFPNHPTITWPVPNWFLTLTPYWIASKSEAIL